MCWVWSLLSAGIAAGYLAVTAWLGALLRTRTGPAVSPVAVACVAIAFEPVRSCRPRSADRLRQPQGPTGGPRRRGRPPHEAAQRPERVGTGAVVPFDRSRS